MEKPELKRNVLRKTVYCLCCVILLRTMTGLININGLTNDLLIDSVQDKTKDPIFANNISSDDELEKIFMHRRKVLERGCSVIDKIEKLMLDPETKFEELLNFHRQIYDLTLPLQKKQPQCTFNWGFHISHIKDLSNPFNIIICLPPKCGTTNWQRGMATLQLLKIGRSVPPEKFTVPLLYTILDNVHMKRLEHKKYSTSAHSVINTRNPFTRLHSAWNDKSSNLSYKNHSKQGKEGKNEVYFPISVKAENPVPKVRGTTIYKLRKAFHEPFWKGIEPFQAGPPPFGKNSSFDAFAAYVASNPGNSKMNMHWRSMERQCAPCHLKYQFITHLGTF